MYICDTGAAAGLLTKVVMEININEAFAGKDIGVDEKVSVRQGFDTFLCIRMMLGSYNIAKDEKEYYNRHMRRAPDDGI